MGDLGEERGLPTFPLLFGVTSVDSLSFSVESDSSVI